MDGLLLNHLWWRRQWYLLMQGLYQQLTQGDCLQTFPSTHTIVPYWAAGLMSSWLLWLSVIDLPDVEPWQGRGRLFHGMVKPLGSLFQLFASYLSSSSSSSLPRMQHISLIQRLIKVFLGLLCAEDCKIWVQGWYQVLGGPHVARFANQLHSNNFFSLQVATQLAPKH